MTPRAPRKMGEKRVYGLVKERKKEVYNTRRNFKRRDGKLCSFLLSRVFALLSVGYVLLGASLAYFLPTSFSSPLLHFAFPSLVSACCVGSTCSSSRRQHPPQFLSLILSHVLRFSLPFCFNPLQLPLILFFFLPSCCTAHTHHASSPCPISPYLS